MELIFSLDEIQQAAATVLDHIGSNTVFAFHGGMGAGKTTFIHALCEAMGVEQTISSPTFSIINQYATVTGKTVYHMDLYRLTDENEALNAGVEDCLYSGNTCLVEWPEKAPGIFPDNTVHIYINLIDSNTRNVRITE
jgi:tRNA threonylcarbamoyladenosine biosynthesis protein TsaE